MSLSIHQPCKFGYSVQELLSATYNTAGYIAKHFIISGFFSEVETQNDREQYNSVYYYFWYCG